MKSYNAFLSPDMDQHLAVIEKISRDLGREMESVIKQQFSDLVEHSPEGMPKNLLLCVLVTNVQTVIQSILWAYLGCGFLGKMTDDEKGQILKFFESKLLNTIPQVINFQADKIFTEGM